MADMLQRVQKKTKKRLYTTTILIFTRNSNTLFKEY